MIAIISLKDSLMNIYKKINNNYNYKKLIKKIKF